MKKLFYSILVFSFILLIPGEKIKAQEKMIEGYYSSGELDGVKNASSTMYKINKLHDLNRILLDVLHSPRLYDGSKKINVLCNYNMFVDENGKFVKVVPVDQLPKDGSKWKEDIIINPQEATDIMKNELSKYEFKLGKKGGKPVKYYYNYVYSMSRSQYKDENEKQPEIIAEGDAFYKSLDKVPAPVTVIKPHYPEIAKRAGIEGKVMVRILVDEKGSVAEAEVVKEVGSGLDESAVTAVKAARFNPGILNGKPVKVRIVIPVEYHLSK